MAYYKTNDPATVAAFVAEMAASQALNAAAKAFGERFGGAGRTIYDLHGRRFGGVIFKPAKPTDIWTVATERDHRFQRPRAAARKGTTPERRDELKQLRVEWESNLPKQKVDFEPVYKALGTDWGQLLFCGINLFLHEGTVYVQTTAKLGAHVAEILGSEYMKAQEARKASEVAA